MKYAISTTKILYTSALLVAIAVAIGLFISTLNDSGNLIVEAEPVASQQEVTEIAQDTATTSKDSPIIEEVEKEIVPFPQLPSGWTEVINGELGIRFGYPASHRVELSELDDMYTIYNYSEPTYGSGSFSEGTYKFTISFKDSSLGLENFIAQDLAGSIINSRKTMTVNEGAAIAIQAQSSFTGSKQLRTYFKTESGIGLIVVYTSNISQIPTSYEKIINTLVLE